MAQTPPKAFEPEPLPPPTPGEPALPISLQRKPAGPKPPKMPLPQPVTRDEETRIGLLVRDPQWIFAYWEIAPNEQKRFGLDDTFRTPRLMLRVYELFSDSQPTSQSEFFFDIGLQRHVRAWYIEPPHEAKGWRAALGILRDTGRFEAMCLSNFVQAPPAHAAVDAEGKPWQGPEFGMPDINDPEKIAEIFRMSIGEGLPSAVHTVQAPENPVASAPWTGPLSPMPLKAGFAPAPTAPEPAAAPTAEIFRPFAPVGSNPENSVLHRPLTIPGLAPSSDVVTGGPIFPTETDKTSQAQSPLQVPFTGSSNLIASER